MTITVTANTRLKINHPAYLRRALLVALAMHLLLFLFAPPFAFTPYELEETEPITAVTIVEDVTTPLPTPEPERPAIDITSRSDDDPVITDTPFPPPPDFARTTRPRTGQKKIDPFIAFDRLPELVYYQAPAYPDLAREAGIEGTVRVRILVGADGAVINVSLISSDVTPMMEKSALEAAKKCRFNPAKQRTRPVRAHVVIPFNFRLH